MSQTLSSAGEPRGSTALSGIGGGQRAEQRASQPQGPGPASRAPRKGQLVRSAWHTRGMAPRVRPQPLLAVRDVPASARWYATLLGAERTSETMASDHAHLYDRLLVDGALVLQLHAWNAEDHPNLVDPDGGRNGHGVLVWFELDDLDAAAQRARALAAEESSRTST